MMKKNDISKLSLADIRDALKLLVSLIIYPFIKKKYVHSWLICERKNSAEDNGWIFYQWMKKNHPDQQD